MTIGPQTRSSSSNNRAIATSTAGSTLADVLERVLDKGIVIAGDISVSVGSTELLSIRIRLLISSVDKAREIGINWWESDPYLNAQAQAALNSSSAKEVNQLQERIQSLEAELRSLRAALPEKSITNGAESATVQTAPQSSPSVPISPAPPPAMPNAGPIAGAAAPGSNTSSANTSGMLEEQDQALILDALTLDALMDEL